MFCTRSWQMTSVALSLLTNAVISTQKATLFERHNLSLVKPSWLSPITSIFSTCLSIFSRSICSVILLCTQVRLIGLQLPGSSFTPFLKMMVTFFFQSVDTSLDFHDFSNIMDGGLATSSASSLRIFGCISSCPVDSCTFRFCRWAHL